MRQTIVILLAIISLLPSACDTAFIGLIPLAGIGLVGVKLYLGMRLLGGSSSMLLQHLPNLAFPRDEDDDDDDNDNGGNENNVDNSTPRTMQPSRLHRRAIHTSKQNAFPRFNPEILKFIHKIDDDQCFEKFFCQLGAERKAFGSFGMNIALMLEFYISDRTAWFAKAMEHGRKLHKKELCPGRCESDDIKKVVNYVSKQLFTGY